MAVRVRLLGHPQVIRDGEPVVFETRKAMALLAALALADRPRSRDGLCELLYPGQPPDRARGALRRTLSTLRKGIGDEWIDAVGDGIGLARGPGLEVDVEDFRALTGDGATGEQLAEAVGLVGGPFLEGFALRDSPDFDDWQVGVARALDQELASALRRHVDALVARGEVDQALPAAQRWLELDRLNEAAHRQLMRIYAWNGDRVAALEQYRTCVRALSQELGVTPLEETTALYTQVGDGDLPQPVTVVTVAPPVAAPALGQLPLVGRARQLDALVTAHGSATSDGTVAVIEGEAGAGRTRLADELAARVRGAGGVVLSARCYADEAGIVYGPVVDLLRQAARLPAVGSVAPQRLADASLLLPELADVRDDVPAPIATDSPGAQVRVLEAIVAVLGAAAAGPVPGVIVLDDAHAADEATIDLVTYLARRLAGLPLLLLLTWRSEALAPGHRLRRVATGATVVKLGRLAGDDLVALAAQVRPDAEPGLAERLGTETEGLPMFVAEYLAALAAGSEDWTARPLLDARLEGIGGADRQVLEAAAAIGRSCDSDTLRRASGRTDEETAAALERLVAHGLMREAAGAEPGHEFCHDRLRALVYEETGLARRSLLHGRIAAALAGGRAPGEGAALVAAHLRLAGDRAGAAEQHHTAAEHAASVYANADALEHLEAALALGHPDAAAINERAGDLLTRLGRYGEALARYEGAAALAGPGRLAAIEHKLGDVYHRRGEWSRARSRFEAALAGAGAPGLQARIRADLSLTLHQSGEAEAAGEHARQAVVLAEAAGDRRAEAQAHNILGVLSGEAAELERSLGIARELGDPSAQAAALNNLALLRRDAGDIATALRLTQEALSLCALCGDRHREAALENSLADLHHAAGDEESAMTHLKRAVTIFGEVGGDQATRQPEIWKLVSW